GGARLYVARVYNGTGGLASGAIGSLSGTTFDARFPGVDGNGTIKTTAVKAPATVRSMAVAPDRSFAQVTVSAALKEYVKTGGVWKDSAAGTLATPPNPTTDYLVTLTVSATDAGGDELVYTGLGFDPAHPSYVGTVLGAATRRADFLARAFSITVGSGIT